MKNCNLRNFFLLVLLNAAMLTTACGGGGGGGGGGVTAAQPSGTVISSSSTAKNFIARQIAGTYSSLDSYAGASLRNSRSVFSGGLKATVVTEPAVGQVRIAYDKEDTVNLWGVKYTYHAGYQDLIARDASGNPTGNENLIDSLEINSVDMACRIDDGASLMNLIYNGKMLFSGLLEATTITVRVQNLNMAGNINNIDQINWTINGNVSVSQSSYPYPVKGSNESGTMIFNGHTYSYSTNYNGSNLATVIFTGAETFNLIINLATGAVVESSSSASANIVGSWKLIEENRFDGMAPVKPNASGNVSLIHFSSDGSVKIETVERYTDASLDHWQSFNVPPKATHGSWQLSGSQLTLKSGELTSLHNVIFNGNDLFTQTNQYGEKFTWQRI